MVNFIKIHPDDNVGVAIRPIAKGETVDAGGVQVTALEEIKADAGLDIGFTLIGMHLKKVAVPVRLKNDFIGSAKVLAARVRPKFIGGERAHYNSELL